MSVKITITDGELSSSLVLHENAHFALRALWNSKPETKAVSAPDNILGMIQETAGQLMLRPEFAPPEVLVKLNAAQKAADELRSFVAAQLKAEV